MTLPSENSYSDSSLAKRLIESKHNEYAKACKQYRVLYFATRLLAGLSAGLLPFVVSGSPSIATALSIAIVVATVVDMVYNPKDRWKLYSRAADLLTIERLRAAGEYDQQAPLLELLVATETAKLEQLVNIDDIIAKARHAQSSR